MKVLITRPRSQANGFAAALKQAGFDVVFFPVIEIAELEDTTHLDNALQNLGDYDWFVLTSVNGVHAVWARMKALGLDQFPASVQVAAIGPKTGAALQAHGIQPAFIPEEYVAEAILPGLGDLRDRRVLLCRADIARKALPELIEQAGGIAHEVVAYQTLPGRPDLDGLFFLRLGVDVITLTSPSTVKSFISIVRTAGFDPLDLPGDPYYACIGPITAKTAHEEKLPNLVVADEYTTEGLIKTIQALKPR